MALAEEAEEDLVLLLKLAFGVVLVEKPELIEEDAVVVLPDGDGFVGVAELAAVVEAATRL